MKYFAYGSNMSLIRLRERVPSAEVVGVFTLKAHQLLFHKSSKDGSGKCDAFETGNDYNKVIGALFEINKNEKKHLDRAEGLGYGYEEKIVTVQNDSVGEFEAVTYHATKIDSLLMPYSWYLNHVIIGAREIQVPAQYLAIIESTKCIVDPDKNRDSRQRSLYN
jgi:gamma-glutamylcyclotransferase